MIIALTGNIGSGKSLAAKELNKMGAKIIDADYLARTVVSAGSIGLEGVTKRFGQMVLNKDGCLNRKALGLLVFNDSEKRKALEDILHPLIREAFLEELKKHDSNEDLIVYVIPLFFESRFSYPEVNKSLLIASDKENCIKRIVERDKLTPLEAQARYDAQMPTEEKLKLADYVIWNDGSDYQFIEKVRGWRNALSFR